MSTAQPESIGESLRLILGDETDLAARMPKLWSTFEQVAQLCTESHAAPSGSSLSIGLAGIESGSPGELLGETAHVDIGALLRARRWDCDLFASVDRSIVFALVDLLLGGEAGASVFNEDRAFSRIETNLLRIFFERLADALGGAFAPGGERIFMLEDVPCDISVDAVGGDSAVIALARFDVEIMEQSGQLRLMVPRAALDAMRQALAEAPAAAAPAPDDGWRQHIRNEFGRSNVTLVAILEERPMMLGEISSLKVGQIVQLSATPGSLVRVECNGEPMFRCRLGQSGGAYTLQVEDHVDSSQEFIDDLLSA